MSLEKVFIDLDIIRDGFRGDSPVSNPLDYVVFYSLSVVYNPDVIFECGTNTGLSSIIFRYACPHIPIFSWDIVDYDKAEGFFDKDIKFQLASFSETAWEKLQDYDTLKKLIFIDGAHDEQSVFDDFNAVKKYLRSGDVIVFHDSVKRKSVEKALKVLVEQNSDYLSRDYTLDTKLGITVFEWR